MAVAKRHSVDKKLKIKWNGGKLFAKNWVYALSRWIVTQFQFKAFELKSSDAD